MKSKANSTQFWSLSTPNHKMQLKTWLAELAVIRSHPNIKLPPKFWTDTRWKWKYVNEIKAITKFIKKYGDKIVLKAFVRSRARTFSSYGDIELELQREIEIQKRIRSPKDTGELVPEKKEPIIDLREPYMTKKSVGLFSKLEEFENEI